MPSSIVRVFRNRGSAITCALDLVAFYDGLAGIESDGILIAVESCGVDEAKVNEWG